MKRILILLCLPLLTLAQQTYVPDDNFEAYLEANGMGNGIANDDYVFTSAIDTLNYLDVSGWGVPQNQTISVLTGIEDFTALDTLNCQSNQLTTLDVSNNTALTYLRCDNNQLTTLDVRNGNNPNFTNVTCSINANLTCISVDDWQYSLFNWTGFYFSFDPQHYFSDNCSGTSIEDHTTNKKLLRTIDVLGRETKNNPLFYIYDDGTVEKRITIE